MKPKSSNHIRQQIYPTIWSDYEGQNRYQKDGGVKDVGLESGEKNPQRGKEIRKDWAF